MKVWLPQKSFAKYMWVLKLDSKTKGPRGGSSIQCRGHQAIRYMSHLLQGWFVLPEKQFSREDWEFFFCFVCLFFETGFLCVAWPSRNSLCRPGQPQTQKSACLCLPSARIKGELHHCPARENFIVWDFQVFCGTTSSTAHHATYYIHSLTSGQKKSVLLFHWRERTLWFYIPGYLRAYFWPQVPFALYRKKNILWMFIVLGC